jgi:hypothetical protein
MARALGDVVPLRFPPQGLGFPAHTLLSLEAYRMKKFALIAAVTGLSLSWNMPAAAADGVDLKTLEKSVDKALKAYNDGDHKNFWAEFSKTVDALKTKEIFDVLYTNGYKATYGKLVKRGELIKDRSELTGETGLARYKAEFEKDKKVQIDINWVKEGNEIKFQQIQINKLQE